jgi:hypothetical protein
MRHLAWVWVVGLLAGCPRVGRVTWKLDLTGMRGTILAEDIGTDDPRNAVEDFAALVNQVVLGDALALENPAWRLGERKLFERDGKLNGTVEFGFARPEDADLFQYDKKSALLWCAPLGEVVATSGAVVPPYPACVMFDRKQRSLSVTVSDDGPMVSLLPVFRIWSGGPIGVSDVPTGLEALLRDGVEVPVSWATIGLPAAGGKVVHATESGMQVAHVGLASAVLPAYEALLGGAGFTRLASGDETSRWSRGDEVVTLSATQAGGSVIIALAR